MPVVITPPHNVPLRTAVAQCIGYREGLAFCPIELSGKGLYVHHARWQPPANTRHVKCGKCNQELSSSLNLNYFKYKNRMRGKCFSCSLQGYGLGETLFHPDHWRCEVKPLCQSVESGHTYHF